MIGFNGGLIGAVRDTSTLQSLPGVWTLGEQVVARRRGLWPGADPYFSNVSLLLHGDGTNGSTTIIDSSLSPKTVTVFGNAQISTAQSRFGGSSITFDGSGDYIRTPYIPGSYDWWASDYTLEAWIYASSFANWNYTFAGVTNGTLVGNVDPGGAANYWSLGVLGNGTVRFAYFNGASISITSTAAAALNNWNHVAFTRSANGIAVWVNGIGTNPVAVSGTPQSATGLGLVIGQVNSVSISGFVDEIRITKGFARYTNNFTVPDAPFPGNS